MYSYVSRAHEGLALFDHLSGPLWALAPSEKSNYIVFTVSLNRGRDRVRLGSYNRWCWTDATVWVICVDGYEIL